MRYAIGSGHGCMSLASEHGVPGVPQVDLCPCAMPDVPQVDLSPFVMPGVPQVEVGA